MTKPELLRQPVDARRFAIPLALGLLLLAAHSSLARPADEPEANPWQNSQIIETAQLAKALSNHSGEAPAVVCVGFDFLFKAAHIPGASYAGPAREAKGLDALKKWASSIPRDREVVLYCGCCPMRQCPNVRPAFKTLAAMGFKHLEVLDLPDDFQKNWVGKGYPVGR